MKLYYCKKCDKYFYEDEIETGVWMSDICTVCKRQLD